MTASDTKTRHRSLILPMVTAVVFASLGLARFGYSVVLPSMQRDLGLTNTQTGAIATANLVGYLVFAVASGAMAVHFGPKRVIIGGLLVAAAGMLWSGAVSNVYVLGVSRLLTGCGSGAGNVPAMGLLSAWFGAKGRGRAAGIGVTGSSFALIVLGPLVPCVLTQSPECGWRLCWMGFGCATLVIALAAALLLRNSPDEGTVPRRGDVPHCARLRDVYRSWHVWHLGLVYAAFGFSYIIYLTFFVRHLTGGLGYSREVAGVLFMTLGWTSLLCGILWGTVSDLIGRRRALALVYCVHAVAFTLFGLGAGRVTLFASAILFGLSAWSVPAIMAATCGDVVGGRLASAALGFVTLFFGIGQAAGPSVAGILADATDSFSAAFLLAAGVALLGVVCAGFLPSTNRGRSTDQR